MSATIGVLPALGVALTAFIALLGFIYRELRAIHKQQAAQGTLLLFVIEGGDYQVPDEIRDGVFDSGD